MFVAQGTQDLKQRPAVFWSPDSSKLVTYRTDTRSVGRFANLQFVPPGQLRPKVFSVVYPLPGEVLVGPINDYVPANQFEEDLTGFSSAIPP